MHRFLFLTVWFLLITTMGGISIATLWYGFGIWPVNWAAVILGYGATGAIPAITMTAKTLGKP